MAFTIHCTAATVSGAYCAGLAVYQVDLPVYGVVGRVCEYHANHAVVNSSVTSAGGAIVDGDAFIPSAWLKPLEQPRDDQAETELPPTPDTTVPRCSLGHPNHGDDRRARYRVVSRGVFRGYVCEFHSLNARLTYNQCLMHSPKNELANEFLWEVNCIRCDGIITEDSVMRNVCNECDAPMKRGATTTSITTTEGVPEHWGVTVRSNTTESTASMTTISNGTGVPVVPPPAPTAPPAKGTTLTAVLTADAQDAAWRLAGSQFIKLTRDPLVGLLSRHLGPDDEALRGRIAAFLQTEIGTALLASILSAGVSTLPASVAGETPQRLARELRVRAMADAGDVVAELLMGPLRQVVSLYLQDIQPNGPASLEPGGIRPIVTVAERVESEVSR